MGDLIVYDGRARHRHCAPTNGNYRWAQRRTERRDDYCDIQRAEMAAEQAAEARLLGIREY